MKIKTKLVAIFITVTAVPLLLIYLMVMSVMNYGAKSLDRAYGINSESNLLLDNSVKTLDRLTESVRLEIENTADDEPAQLEDTAYLDKINAELSHRYSIALVRRGEEIVYDGGWQKLAGSERAGGASGETIPYPDLPSFGSSSAAGTIYNREFGLLMKQIDFRYPNGDPGSLFIVTKASGILPEVRKMFSAMLFLGILIIVFAGVFLVLWVYSTILHPLSELQSAAQKIRDGNLDFTLEAESDDEIGELCRNFEEMRIRLKESAEEKVRDDRESKMLISNISHDLRTPLTAIKGYVEGIHDGVASSPEKLDKYLHTIYNKANDMDRLIDELTLYSKIDTNRIPYHFVRLNVREYFGDCIDEVGIDMEARGVEFAYRNSVSDDVEIVADPEQLKRVINNIISNSLKYLDKKPGKISIEIRDEGDFVETTIRDNGVGIAREDLPKIFDRFYRTDASRNSSRGGSGIGLSIVKKIIEDHGGRIWATSREGEGTAMHFELRKYQEAEQIEQDSDH
jgi:signal transduction histidine kinase